ncbi:probable endochitinase [Folsomia candida]|uniref:probable endochitinase n=1 Tax=Folsomia candida TaxID=158441 RepID=UPI000B8FB791|nr:probable endochitinase [Folsomia candida]
MYYRCLLIMGQMVKYEMTCPANSYYNQVSRLCALGTCQTTTPTTTSPTTVLSTIIVTTIDTTTAEVATTPATTLTPSTTTAGPEMPSCTAPGFYPYPGDCTRYIKCVAFTGGWYIYINSCPAESYFDVSIPACVFGTCPASSPTTLLPTTTEIATVPDITPEATTTQVVSTTLAPFQCATTEGIFPEPTDCSKYNRCIIIAGAMRLYTYICPSGSYFDPSKNLCVTGTCQVTLPSTTLLPATTTIATVPTTPSTTSAPPTTAAPFQCGTTEGTFTEPTNCTKYNRCIIIAGAMRLYIYTCPSGSYFDASKNLCVVGTC